MTEAGGFAETDGAVSREAVILNKEGLHARPVMRFVDLASTFQCEVKVRNISRKSDCVDGKSAMQMMLLEATKGNVLRIEALGPDAETAVEALANLVRSAFDMGEDAVE